MGGLIGFAVGLAIISVILGLACAVGLVFLIFYLIRRGVYALKGKEYVPLLKSGNKQEEYHHQDVAEGSGVDSVSTVLKRCLNNDGSGKYARAGLSALSSCERKTEYFRSVLDAKFEPNSLSWEKFAAASDSTQHAVLANCATLANKVQVFDYQGFRKAEHE